MCTLCLKPEWLALRPHIFLIIWTKFAPFDRYITTDTIATHHLLAHLRSSPSALPDDYIIKIVSLTSSSVKMLIIDWGLYQGVIRAIRVCMRVLEEVKVVLPSCEKH